MKTWVWISLTSLFIISSLYANSEKGTTVSKEEQFHTASVPAHKEEKQVSTFTKNPLQHRKPLKQQNQDEATPWFIGTLLAQYGEVISPGKIEITPSLVLSRVYGNYDHAGDLIAQRKEHLYSLLFSLESGIIKNVDITLDTGMTWEDVRTESLHLTDTQIYLSVQLLRDKKGSAIPDLRLMFGENFPTGKFDHLNSRSHLADVTGSGAYGMILVFILQKIFYSNTQHPHKWNVNLEFNKPTSVNTHGLSIYGGRSGAKGIAFPGNLYILNLSYEYKFGQHLGWGMDMHYVHQAVSFFHVYDTTALFSKIAPSDTISLAPEIEYNFNENFALMVGMWCTLFGKNSTAFLSGFLSLSYLF